MGILAVPFFAFFNKIEKEAKDSLLVLSHFYYYGTLKSVDKDYQKAANYAFSASKLGARQGFIYHEGCTGYR